MGRPLPAIHGPFAYICGSTGEPRPNDLAGIGRKPSTSNAGLEIQAALMSACGLLPRQGHRVRAGHGCLPSSIAASARILTMATCVLGRGPEPHVIVPPSPVLTLHDARPVPLHWFMLLESGTANNV